MNRLARLFWWFLPCTYRGQYADKKGVHFVVWKQWFGKIYNGTDVLVDVRKDPKWQYVLDYYRQLQEAVNQAAENVDEDDDLDLDLDFDEEDEEDDI